MRLALSILAASFLCAESSSAQSIRIRSAIDNANRTQLTSGAPARRAGAHDLGRVPPSFPMRLTLRFAASADQKAQLRRLLELQSPRSALYRQWLTPEEYADRFGVSSADIRQIENWLTANGFQRGAVARSRTFLVFSGTASQVERA